MTVDFNINQPLKKLSLHEWVYNDNLESLTNLKNFLNWLSEEFTLFLQDDKDVLTVFFPNGYFVVGVIESTNNANVEFQIHNKLT